MKSRIFTLTVYSNGPIITPETKEEFSNLRHIQGFRYLYGNVEICPTTQKEHIQGFIYFQNPRASFKEIKAILPTAHIEMAKGDFESNFRYCSKDAGDPTRIIEIGDKPSQGSRSDLLEAAKLVLESGIDGILHNKPELLIKYPKGIDRLNSEAKRLKYTPAPEPDIIWRDWQREVIDLSTSEPHPRQIHFRVDPIGAAGKSFLARQMALRGEVYWITGGKHDRIYHGYGFQRIIIFDIPRDYVDESTGRDLVPYQVMETFKNGTAPRMYGEPPIIFKIPHVFVFINFFPNKEKLSLDRYDIKEI